MSFAKNLKKAMDERNMTQSELAKQIDKGKSSISQYLSGKNVPKDDVKQKIADALDCTIEYLDSEVTEKDTGSGIRNISVAEAARRLGKSQQYIRVGLQNQRLPFGTAVYVKRWSYHISPKLLT
ncbi:helix-turn-helix domain-containing protein [Tepidibacter hydrothermalis]|uniref:Helix-turn-helix transcriptional regulator n=1 Tax=Tepidibacter hydrothermalis TaxID=3036126 RepID=A0ABY8EAH9_9FIRM|nr:helix-turn-helix transcriptional regulator [Tepidibacter hydrothermalis]WFD09951.1 helix-turn-helix transcriptional regulator [Tepidibacter hydrothermalis]